MSLAFALKVLGLNSGTIRFQLLYTTFLVNEVKEGVILCLKLLKSEHIKVERRFLEEAD